MGRSWGVLVTLERFAPNRLQRGLIQWAEIGRWLLNRYAIQRYSGAFEKIGRTRIAVRDLDDRHVHLLRPQQATNR